MTAQSTSTPVSFWRSLHALNLTRIVIAAVLLLFWSVKADSSLWGGKFGYHQTCVIYLVLGLAFGIITLFRRRHFMAQLLVQVVTDLIVISLLFLFAGGMKSGLAILYLFPLCSAAILVKATLALFFAAVVSLFLLGQSLVLFFKNSYDSSGVQAGLYGATFMASVFILNRLAARLITQETLATQRGKHLQIQEAINRLVISSMDDGLIVIDSGGQVFASNPSVDKKLGINLHPDGDQALFLSDFPSLKPLSDAFFVWHEALGHIKNSLESDSAHVKIKPSDDVALSKASLLQDEQGKIVAHLKARFAKVETPSDQDERFVIFLQDVAGIENQAQQLKLASMGRLTASIAHEVRNPLAAISHASAPSGGRSFQQHTSTPFEYRVRKCDSYESYD